MRMLFAAACLWACSVPALAQWNYTYNPRTPSQGTPPNLSSVDTSTFIQNGAVQFGNLGGVNSWVGGGTGVSGSLIQNSVPAGLSNGSTGPNAEEYEVSTILRIQTGGGHFMHYLRASTNALSSNVSSASYFLVDLSNPTFTAAGCMATLNFWEDMGYGSGATLKASSQVPCNDHMQMRSVVMDYGSPPSTAFVWTMIDGQIYSAYCDLPSGKAGIGVLDTPSINGIENVQIGRKSIIVPANIDRTSIGTSSFPDHVDMHWADPLDVTGVGLLGHGIGRNGQYWAGSFNSNNYTDNVSVAANTTYSYQISTTSYHGVTSPSPPTFAVSTPPPGSIDPRRVGLRPTGSYWGALGENIDNLSGNLNFSVPLIRAKARGGWGVTFSLSYNSQMWRQDSGGTWLRGQDVGYGMGWNLMAGSLTPAWNNQIYAVDHWIYTDATGAEYRLTAVDTSNPSLFTSTESINVTYDANTGKLWFPNGSFWLMNSASSGEEQDAGTHYPTLMQDKNGNQIVITYDAGLGLNYYNSSARILTITDIRSMPGMVTYSFHYSGGPGDLIPHLNTISTNNPTGNPAAPYRDIYSGESYYFYRASGQTFTSPWSDAYGTTNVLQSVVGAANPSNASDPAAPNRTYSFLYDQSAQLTKATLPPGGYLRWDYGAHQFAGARNQVEVINRYLVQDAPGQGNRAEALYQISHESATGTVHNTTNIIDPTNAAKIYTFTDASTDTWRIGLLQAFQKKQSIYGTLLEGNAVTWLQSPSNNPYVHVLETQEDNQKSKTQQFMDSYGNLTEQDFWDYGHITNTNADRISLYTYAHQQNGTYTNYYLRSLLTSIQSADGNGQNTQTLKSIGYDLGQCTSYNASDPLDLTNAFLHDPTNRTDHVGNASVVTDAGNGQTCRVYDVAGNVYLTEGPGEPQHFVTASAGTNFSAPGSVTLNGDSQSLTTFTYTPWLGVSSFSGPNGVTGTYTYDAFAQVSGVRLTTGGYVTVSHYPGTVSNTSSFPGAQNGYPWMELSTIDNHYSRKTLDGLGRVIREEKGFANQNSLNPASSVVDTKYAPCACSPVGKMVQQSQPYAAGGTVYWTTYTYDGKGRTLTVTGPDGQSRTTMTYNAQASGVSAGPPSVGNSITTVDPKGNWKIVTSDSFGNVITVTEPNSGAPGQSFLSNYTYDKLNHLVLVSLPRNGYTQTRSFTYDSTTLKLLSETHPETGTTSYAYQNGSHLESLLRTKTDAKSQQAFIDISSYDAYNRPLRVKFLNQGGAEDVCQQINSTYDTYPSSVVHGAGTSSWGHKVASSVGPTDNTGSCAVSGTANGARINQNFLQAFYYTSAGQTASKSLIFNQIVTNADQSVVPPTQTVWNTSYTYDDEGYLTSTAYPTGQTLITGLDYLKRPSTLTYFRNGQTVNGPIIDSVAYNAADQVTLMSWPGNNQRDFDANGYPAFTETRAYNSFNQVTQIQTQVSGTPSGVDLNYSYPSGQNNGQISSVASGLDGNYNANYTYDSLNRLTGVSGAKTQSYSYDGWGNLYSKTGDGTNFTVNIDQASNRPYGGTICYDQNGNLLGNVGGCPNLSVGYLSDYTYDNSNRLRRVASSSSGSGDQSAEYYNYTADNKRVSTIRPNGTVGELIYVYGAKNEIAAICTAHTIGQTPVCAPGDLKFAGRVIRQNGFPVTTDRLGSVIGGPNGPGFSFGAAPAKYYMPYGEQWNTTNGPAFPGNANFATYFKDQSTGLDYADQRYYNSLNGFSRFMSADPYKRSTNVTDSASWNRYSYTGSDPVNRLDPSGQYYCFAEDECGPCDEEECGYGPEPEPSPEPILPGPTPNYPTLPGNFRNRTGGGNLPAYQRALSALKTFSTTKADCLKDLGNVGLSVADVAKFAGEANFVSYSNLSAFNQMQALSENADLLTDSGKNTIYYVDPNLVNTKFKTLLGELLHEIVHLSGFGGTGTAQDTALQDALSLQRSNITQNISNKLAQDCFKGAK